MDTLQTAYRGDGSDRPSNIPLPPTPMPLFRGGRLRKQWRYLSVWSRELSLCVGRAAVGPARQEFWAVWDRAQQQFHDRTHMIPRTVQFSPGRVVVRDGNIHMHLEWEQNKGFQVVTPYGASAYTWVHKQLVQVRGTVRLNSVERPVQAVALVEETAGYHARHTRWCWSAGAGKDVAGRAIAWNVIVGYNDGPGHTENTVWVEGEAREVGQVRFAEDLSSVTFAEGGTLRFTEEAVRERSDNLLLIRSSYRQPFGRFQGSLPGGIELREGYGVMEVHEAVW
jgi:hypothetical protein